MPRFQLYRIYTARPEKAGFGHVPVISLNLSGLEGNPGFKLTPVPYHAYRIRRSLRRYFFMKCVYHMRPYEAVPGTTDQIHRKWAKICKRLCFKRISFPAQIQKALPGHFTTLIRSKYWISKNPASELSGKCVRISAGSQ